ncbi:hypothetical protein K4K52_011620 [Colletotrichum sp. SAR 10_76]|nr:hypothetical protein K4K51_013029 [Colletotrichum sp. SAR 10_75]KAI8210785.1 hypothetical protein K4K52_011620 [Colletotrichum sp. SAR 10_76]
MKPQLTVARPCGYMEKYSTARHSLNFYHCVSVTGRYAVPPGTDNATLRDTLQRAVAQVVLEQPMLRVGIIDQDKQSTSFVHIPRVDLSEHIQLFGPSGPDEVDTTLSKHLSYQHSQLWPDIEQRPPWRVSIVPISDGEETPSEVEIIYAFHHAISDGTSGSIFHQRLLEALGHPMKDIPGLEGKTIAFPELPVLPPPQHELVSSRLSWTFFLATLWDAFGPSWLKSKPAIRPWKARPIDLAQPNQTSTHILRIPAALATKLLAVARSHSVTLTPLLHALIVASASRQIPESEAPTFEPCSPISLRRYLPPDSAFDAKNQMLVLVTSGDHPIPPALVAKLRSSSGTEYEDAIWKVAASVKSTMNDKLASLPHDDPGSMLKYVGDFHDFFRQKNGQERSNSWELSNLGAIDGGSGSWKMTRAVFSQSASVLGPGFSANMAGVVGGEITVTLCWNNSVVEGSLIEGVIADLDAWLPEIASHKPLAI